MTFVFTAALAIALLVGAPVAAHLMRIRRSETKLFAPAHLVPASLPASRQTRKLENHTLFIIRVLAVIALALLGASPLLTCSRLSLVREGGASVALALVLDDSMSMQALDDGTTSRFTQAVQDARDLLASAQTGDSVAVVLAGEPARVAVAPTTDLELVKRTIEDLVPSDRATDLDGALALSASLVSGMPQPQQRVIVLTDLCDGNPDGPPLGENVEVPVWIVTRKLTPDAHDCAVLHAEERNGRVVAKVACTGKGQDMNRSLVARHAGQELARVALHHRMASEEREADIEIALPASSFADEVALEGGSDLIPDNDRTPVMRHVSKVTIGVLTDSTLSMSETGGPPAVEQALRALQTDAVLQPMSVMPDTIEALGQFTAMVIDDPPGFAPEAREALGQWLQQGGIALIGLGPRAANAPLGSSLDPIVPGTPRWLPDATDGVMEQDAVGFGPSGPSLQNLGAKGRTHFAHVDDKRPGIMESLLRWSDGQPFLVERTTGRGRVMLIGLPFSPSWSDLPLRPAFLSLLWRLSEAARARAGSHRVEVGQSWLFEDATVEVRSKVGPYPVTRWQDKVRVTPERAGRYDIRRQEDVEVRYATIASREVDLRTRRASDLSRDQGWGATSTTVDISRWVALVLLGLVAVELVVRVGVGVLRGERLRGA